MNFSIGRSQRGQSLREVQAQGVDGVLTEYNTQEEVQMAIFNKVHWKRYNLAEEAPICSGLVRDQFGYSATSPAARLVLKGQYVSAYDMDVGMLELFAEIAIIRKLMKKDLVSGCISRERCQQRWKKVKEDTSLLVSGLHFGHYIAGAECNYILQYHALQVLIALRSGRGLD